MDFDILPSGKAGRNCQDPISYSIGGTDLNWSRFCCQQPSISGFQTDLDFIGIRLKT